MPKTPDSDAALYEDKARQSLEDDIHYLTSLTQMADLHEVVAREEVFSANGTKLIAKGAAIGSGLRERLLKHVLLKPIDQSLAVKDGVTADMLAEEAGRLIANEAFLQKLLPTGEGLGACQEALRQLALPEQLAFKLTVMHTRLPWLFSHIMKVVLIAHFLAEHLKLSAQQCSAALLTGLVHDLGELHTDPVLLDRRHRMSNEEMHFVDVHPLTGYLIAREILPAHPEVATAILQHHERLDGSGYPSALPGKEVGCLARIISIADACASIMSRFRGSNRLSILLRLSRQKFDPEMIALLQRGLGFAEKPETPTQTLEQAHIEAAAKLLRQWSQFSATLQGHVPPGLGFLFERMAELRMMLLQFGLYPEEPQSLQALIADQDIATELAAAFDEVRWQATDIQREVRRRLGVSGSALTEEELALLDSWLVELHDYLQAIAPQDKELTKERRRT